MRVPKDSQRGDTLIEVLLSMAVLSLIIVGANAFMNFGMKNAITATEHTQVRNLIVGQAELLRYMRDNAEPGGDGEVSRAWSRIEDNFVKQPGDASAITDCTPNNNNNAFYIRANYPNSSAAPLDNLAVRSHGSGNPNPEGHPYAVPGDGLWVEAIRYQGDQDYIDFHIRGCWTGIGTSVEQRVNTVVRLRTE